MIRRINSLLRPGHGGSHGFRKLVIIGLIGLIGYGYLHYRHAPFGLQSAGSGSGLFSSVQRARGVASGRPGNIHSLGGSGKTSKRRAADIDSTPLIDAATRGDKDAVLAQLETFKVNTRDDRDHTALMGAALNGRNDICALLLARGAVASLQDMYGFTAMDYAAAGGFVQTVQLLLKTAKLPDTKYYVEYAQLIAAASMEKPELLPQGALHSVNRITPEGRSPLHIAAGLGAADMAAALIKHGANVNLANKDGQTPLHWAAWNNQTFTMTLLLKNRAAINAVDKGGNSALMLAAEHGNKEAVILLLQKGANKKLRNLQGRSAADFAREKNFPEIAAMLNN